jgi:hypothetical protein
VAGLKKVGCGPEEPEHPSNRRSSCIEHGYGYNQLSIKRDVRLSGDQALKLQV